MCHGSAARLTHQRRRRDPSLLTHLHDGIHHVIGVFLQRVINGRRKIGLRAVIIDPQPATRHRGSERRPHFHQLTVETSSFPQALFNVPNIGNLAPQVKVQELERLQQIMRAQKRHCLH